MLCSTRAGMLSTLHSQISGAFVQETEVTPKSHQKFQLCSENLFLYWKINLSAERKLINRLKSSACGRLFGEVNIVSVSAVFHRISSLVN